MYTSYTLNHFWTHKGKEGWGMFLFWWIGFPSFINALSANKFKVIHNYTIFIMFMVHVVLSSSVTAKTPGWYQVTSFWCFCYLKHGQPIFDTLTQCYINIEIYYFEHVQYTLNGSSIHVVRLNDSMNSFSWLNRDFFLVGTCVKIMESLS